MAGVGYLSAGAPEARVKRAHSWQNIEQRLHVSVDEVSCGETGSKKPFLKHLANTEGLDASSMVSESQKPEPCGGKISPQSDL